MTHSILQDVEALCTASGVAASGDITDVLYSLFRPLVDDIRTDNMGNVLAVRRGRPGAPRIMLQAHLDEIGFLVTSIDDQGFIRVAAAGGIDRRVLAAQRVTVYGDRPYPGVFCSVPPHLATDKQELPDISDFGIDIGMSREEGIKHIPVGSRVGFAADLRMLGDCIISSKALDDRAGIAAILHCLRRLPPQQAEVCVALCVQEELGNRGAAAAARQFDPCMALVTDVSFALTPDANPVHCGRLSAGVMIGIAPTLDKALSDELLATAQECGIPYQTEVMGGKTGTDADVISCENRGIPTGLLSIPQRYMHTPIECVDVNDIAAVGNLMAEIIMKRGAVGE